MVRQVFTWRSSYCYSATKRNSLRKVIIGIFIYTKVIVLLWILSRESSDWSLDRCMCISFASYATSCLKTVCSKSRKDTSFGCSATVKESPLYYQLLVGLFRQFFIRGLYFTKWNFCSTQWSHKFSKMASIRIQQPGTFTSSITLTSCLSWISWLSFPRCFSFLSTWWQLYTRLQMWKWYCFWTMM